MHEESEAFMACASAKYTRKLSACLATSDLDRIPLCIGSYVNNTRIVFFRYDIIIFQMITICHIGNSSCNRYKLSSLKVLTLTSNNVRYIDGNTPAFLTWFTKSDLPVAGTFVLPRLELELMRGPSPGDKLQLPSEWVSSLRTITVRIGAYTI
jgi:hypothetical protein